MSGAVPQSSPIFAFDASSEIGPPTIDGLEELAESRGDIANEPVSMWPLRRPIGRSRHRSPNAKSTLSQSPTRPSNTRDPRPDEGEPGSSNACGITHAPPWVEPLKEELQTIIKMELSGLYKNWIGPMLKRDMKATLEKELQIFRQGPLEVQKGQSAVSTPGISPRDEMDPPQNLLEHQGIWPESVETPTKNQEVHGHAISTAPPSGNREMHGNSTFATNSTQLSSRSEHRELHERTSFNARSTCTASSILSPLRSNTTTERDSDSKTLQRLRRSINAQPSNHSERFLCSATDLKRNLSNGNGLINAYDVSDMYHETGLFQKIARDRRFEYVSLAMVFLNAIWMYFDTDLNKSSRTIAHAQLEFVLTDIMFYTYFLGDLLIRFMAFKRKPDCCKSGWFVLDAALVALYTLDPFVIGILQIAFRVDNGNDLNLPTGSLRLLHATRLYRLSRLVRAFPEMLIMIRGIATALASVGYVFALLGLVTYAFSIALRGIVPVGSEIEKNCFSTVPETMHHLVIYGIFYDSLAEFLRQVKKGSFACFILFWLYIVVASLLIMNMLIGIVCDVMSKAATEEREDIIVDKVNKELQDLLRKFGDDEYGVLTWPQFADFLQSEACLCALRGFDVDVEVLVDMVEDMFFNSDNSGDQIFVARKQILDMVLNLRGSQTASVKDVMVIGKRLNKRFHQLENRLDMIMKP